MTSPASPKTGPVHPTLHFAENEAYIGIRDASGNPWFITQSRQKVAADIFIKSHRVVPGPDAQPYDPLFGRWPDTDLAKFLGGDPAPTFGSTLLTLSTVIEGYYELVDGRYARLIASWIIGSYVFPLFSTFPRLHVRGEGGSGKSKLLQLISLLAFNGLWRIGETPAVLFRLIHPLRPTLCLDEIENLDTTDRKDILAIINAGYKAGGCIDRAEKVGDRFVVKPYEVFAPMALAGINSLNKITAERAIPIHTAKGTNPEILNKDVTETPFLMGLRGLGYRIALTRHHDIRKIYRSNQPPPWLVARLRELYAPLLAIAALADTDGAEGVTDDLLALAADAAQASAATGIGTLLPILHNFLSGRQTALVRPIDLAEKAVSNGAALSARQTGIALDGLGFKKTRDARGMRYLITDEQLAVAFARHTPWISYTPTLAPGAWAPKVAESIAFLVPPGEVTEPVQPAPVQVPDAGTIAEETDPQADPDAVEPPAVETAKDPMPEGQPDEPPSGSHAADVLRAVIQANAPWAGA